MKQASAPLPKKKAAKKAAPKKVAPKKQFVRKKPAKKTAPAQGGGGAAAAAAAPRPTTADISRALAGVTAGGQPGRWFLQPMDADDHNQIGGRADFDGLNLSLLGFPSGQASEPPVAGVVP